MSIPYSDALFCERLVTWFMTLFTTQGREDERFLNSNSPFGFDLFWCHIKQTVNFFIRAMKTIFSFGERCNIPFNASC